jgi:hypothetical protein
MVMDTPEGEQGLGFSPNLVRITATRTGELGIVSRLNPISDLLGLLIRVVIRPAPIATALISDSKVGAVGEEGGFLGFGHRHTGCMD